MNSEKQILKKNEEIYFYYDVKYIYTNTTYDERINKYYIAANSIHWNSVSIGLSIIIFLTVILVYIFLHSIKNVKEIENNRVISDEDINEYGWRNISLDVFRSPCHSYLLASIFGTGIQLFFVIFYSFFCKYRIVKTKKWRVLFCHNGINVYFLRSSFRICIISPLCITPWEKLDKINFNYSFIFSKDCHNNIFYN